MDCSRLYRLHVQKSGGEESFRGQQANSQDSPSSLLILPIIYRKKKSFPQDPFVIYLTFRGPIGPLSVRYFLKRLILPTRLFKEAKKEVDPMDPEVRTAADGILEKAALNNLGILGAEKRVLADGRIQFRTADSQRWVTVGRV